MGGAIVEERAKKSEPSQADCDAYLAALTSAYALSFGQIEADVADWYRTFFEKDLNDQQVSFRMVLPRKLRKACSEYVQDLAQGIYRHMIPDSLKRSLPLDAYIRLRQRDAPPVLDESVYAGVEPASGSVMAIHSPFSASIYLSVVHPKAAIHAAMHELVHHETSMAVMQTTLAIDATEADRWVLTYAPSALSHQIADKLELLMRLADNPTPPLWEKVEGDRDRLKRNIGVVFRKHWDAYVAEHVSRGHLNSLYACAIAEFECYAREYAETTGAT